MDATGLTHEMIRTAKHGEIKNGVLFLHGDCRTSYRDNKEILYIYAEEMLYVADE
jgi:hypothetical protein